MKVLFLSQIVPYPPHGGVLQRGYNLLRELGRHASVHLLAFVHPDTIPTPALHDESLVALRAFCERVEYFPLWAKASPVHKAAALALSSGSSVPFGTIAHRSRPFARRVAELLAGESFDILHVDTIALAPFASGRSGLGTVLTHHNVESVLMERRARVETNPFARQFLRREAAKLTAFERRVAPEFDVNVMVSDVDAATLCARVPGVRTALVPNGVDVSYFVPGRDGSAPALIYTGGMNMFANRDAVMHFVTEIWPAVKARVPDARFFAVGQDPPPSLLALASQDAGIVVTGYVDDIRPLVRQAAVYVVPLRVGGGTRLKVLDAMAMGMPLVSTSVGCEGLDVVPDTHLVIADEPERFARAVVALLGDDQRREELGRAARARVEERYAWPVVGRQLIDVYRMAMDTGRRAS